MKLTFCFLLLFFAANAYSQFSVNKQFHARDTTRTFTIANDQADAFISKIIKNLGNPNTSSSGLHLWNMVKIDGFYKPYNVSIQDGIMSFNSNGLLTWAPFQNQEDKQQKLKALGKNEERHTEIVFEDGNGNNIIRNNKSQQLALDYLHSILR